MSRLAVAAARLASRLAARCGEPVVYRRGGTTVSLAGVRLGRADPVSQPGQAPVQFGDRQCVWSVAAAPLAGLGGPKAGDTLTAAGVVYTVAPPAAGLPAWEWGEPERVTYRLQTVDRG